MMMICTYVRFYELSVPPLEQIRMNIIPSLKRLFQMLQI